MNNIELQEISKLKAMEKFITDRNTESNERFMMNIFVQHEMKQNNAKNSIFFALYAAEKMITRVLANYHKQIIEKRLPYSKCYDAFMELDPYQLLTKEDEKDMIDVVTYNRVINEQQLKLCDLQIMFFSELKGCDINE